MRHRAIDIRKHFIRSMLNNNKIHSSIIHHCFTTVVVKAIQDHDEPLVIEILVGNRARKAAEMIGASPPDGFLAKVEGLLRKYLDGLQIDFTPIHINFVGLTIFQKAVLNAARQVPYGSTHSYCNLAAAAGYPRAIRAAATVMARNRFPIIIPCHRIIHKDGSLGAYSGDWDGEDAALKRSLIQLEKTVSAK